MNKLCIRRRIWRKRSGRCGSLMLLAALVLFAGMFAQITMLSRSSSVSKQAADVEREIAALTTRAEDLELQINETHNLEQIAALARQLGMEQPTEAQIRAVRVVQNDVEDTSTQTAESLGGEKVLN